MHCVVVLVLVRNAIFFYKTTTGSLHLIDTPLLYPEKNAPTVTELFHLYFCLFISNEHLRSV